MVIIQSMASNVIASTQYQAPPSMTTHIWCYLGFPIARTASGIEIKNGDNIAVKMIIAAVCSWGFELSMGHFLDVMLNRTLML